MHSKGRWRKVTIKRYVEILWGEEYVLCLDYGGCHTYRLFFWSYSY